MTDLKAIEAAIPKGIVKAVDALAHRPWTDTDECERRKAALLTLIEGVCRERDELREALLARAKAILAATDEVQK